MIDEKVSAMLAETPAKVMTLLCTALASMAFLFLVSATNASFTGAPVSVPNPVNPAKLMTMVDYTAAGYSSFLHQNLFVPVEQSVAMTTDNVSWIASNASYALGFGQGTQAPLVSQVAGAHIVAPPVQSAAKPSSPPTSDASAPGVFSPILALLTQ
jgi:hypothetical protein